MSDNVNNPSHYNTGSVETIDGIRAALGDAFLDYCRGNVLKYVWRCRHKGNTLEDLRKAAKYLEWAIEEAESEKPNEPQPLAIPEGWRELEFGETRLKTDLYSYGGKWVPYTDFDPTESEFPKYDKRIHHQHIRKIETEKPEHVEGAWVEEADANAKKIKPAETSDASIPDPGPGYRLLSKDPPELVVEGDDFWCDTHWAAWWPSSADCGSAVQSNHDYYRRKIEPAEWIPKVGDKVRLRVPVLYPTRDSRNYEGRITEISQSGRFTIFFASEDQRIRGWVKPKDLHLIEAAS